ncbi:MAG TPA: (Fe-S)-binding protein [Candidatus Eisenbacteria bacterium]|nr:(Fe-S)-binding protein [Candidatus Eisenbacteria bacterium]
MQEPRSYKSSPPPSHFLDDDKALACIHCGLCLAACPTYLETGNENDSPRGRIYLMRAVQDGRLPLGDTAVRHIDLCLGCRACEAACPSGVQYGELLESTRDHIEKNHRRSLFQNFLRRVVIEKIFPFPARLRLALFPANFLKRLGGERLLPKFARDALLLIPDEVKEVMLPEISPAAPHNEDGRVKMEAGSRASALPSPLFPFRRSAPRGRVGFISGCVMSVMFGETNAASVKLLNRLGYEVVTPGGQICCGELYAHSGNLARARDCARHNIEVFEKLELDAIIINAAGCGSTLKEYHHLLHDDPAWAERGRQFSAKVKDLTEWLAERISDFGFQISDLGTVTYHDACHLAHPQRITKLPRDLVRAVAGKHYVELAEADVCCGSAGSYNLTEPEMAERLQQRKIQNILQTGAQIVVTSNPGCILQIRAGLEKAGASQIQVLHIADYLLAAATN